MGARLWTALLILAAVFVMHGLQCAAAPAAGDGSVANPAHIAAAPHLGPAGTTTPDHLPVAPDAGGPDGALSGHAGTADAPVDAGHGGAPHDWAAHLWTACLAVLAAALAVLLALGLPRVVRSGAPTPARGRVHLPVWLTPPRPPDLSVLCLLRI